MEAQERYSRELLDCVEYLLTVQDPASEATYFRGLHKLSAHPSETLAIIRSNAHAVLNDYEEHEFGPSIREDLAFLEVEGRIQEQKLRDLAKSRGEVMSSLKLLCLTAGVALGSILLGERFSILVIGFAGLTGTILGGNWAYVRTRERRPRRLLVDLARARESIRQQLGK